MKIPLMVTDVAPVMWISSRLTAVREMKNRSSSVKGIRFESPKILNRLRPLKSRPLLGCRTPLSVRFLSILVCELVKPTVKNSRDVNRGNDISCCHSSCPP